MTHLICELINEHSCPRFSAPTWRSSSGSCMQRQSAQSSCLCPPRPCTMQRHGWTSARWESAAAVKRWRCTSTPLFSLLWWKCFLSIASKHAKWANSKKIQHLCIQQVCQSANESSSYVNRCCNNTMMCVNSTMMNLLIFFRPLNQICAANNLQLPLFWVQGTFSSDASTPCLHVSRLLTPKSLFRNFLFLVKKKIKNWSVLRSFTRHSAADWEAIWTSATFPPVCCGQPAPVHTGPTHLAGGSTPCGCSHLLFMSRR